MIEVRIEGDLTRLEKLRVLTHSGAERRRITSTIGRAIQKELRTRVKKRVLSSPLELFEGSEQVRRRKAAELARVVSFRARQDSVLVYDRGLTERKVKADGMATAQQAERMRELGFKLSRAYIRSHFTATIAGIIIRKIEADKGRQQKRRRRTKSGSLVLLVWRTEHQAILDEVDVVGIVRRALAA